MLILNRKPNEIIHIGDDIVIKICEIVGNQVRVGIEAPKDVAVHREEIYRRIHVENNLMPDDQAHLL